MADDDDDRTNELIKHGQEAWKSLKRGETWEKWQSIGFALDAGQRDIMRDLNINRPEDGGRAFATRMSAWLTETGFDEIDKGVRSRLIRLIYHLTDVEAWRATLDLKRRIELNHPNSIFRAWPANPYRKPKLDIPKVDPRDEALRQQQEEIGELRNIIAEFDAEAADRAAVERTVAENEAWDQAGDIRALRQRTEAAEQEAADERKAAQSARDQVHELLRQRKAAADATTPPLVDVSATLAIELELARVDSENAAARNVVRSLIAEYAAEKRAMPWRVVRQWRQGDRLTAIDSALDGALDGANERAAELRTLHADVQAARERVTALEAENEAQRQRIAELEALVPAQKRRGRRRKVLPPYVEPPDTARIDAMMRMAASVVKQKPPPAAAPENGTATPADAVTA